MAAIHAVDLDAAGLADLGRHEGYIARQLKRWYGQWNQQKTRELPLVDEVHDALAGMVPSRARPRSSTATTASTTGSCRRRRRRAGRARLGDLHARRPARRRRAAAGVLDRPGRRAERVGRPVDDGAGLLGPRRLAERYAEVSGRDLSNLDFYVAFGYWKLACILEGRVRPLPRRRARRARPRRAGAVQGCRSTAARSDGRRSTLERTDDDADGPLASCRRRLPVLDEPVLVVMLTGWIDASGAAAAAMSTIDKETAATPARHLRRRHVHRLPRPPPDARAARRRQHPARVVGAGAEGRSRRERPRRAAAQRSRARHGVAPLRRHRRRPRRAARRSRRWPPSAPTRSPRRTPGRRTCRRRRRRPR